MDPNLLTLGAAALVLAGVAQVAWRVVAWPVGSLRCRRGHHAWQSHLSYVTPSHDYCTRCGVQVPHDPPGSAA